MLSFPSVMLSVVEASPAAFFLAGRSNSSQKRNHRRARAEKTTLTETTVRIQPCGSCSFMSSLLVAEP